jgi:protein-L-isoaspartate(D-aspartate) O-methyltransferase
VSLLAGQPGRGDRLALSEVGAGRLGAALVDGGVTRLIVGRKAGGAFGYLSVGDAGVPALPGFNRPRAFTL